jgi:hypothetical protein
MPKESTRLAGRQELWLLYGEYGKWLLQTQTMTKIRHAG